MKLYPDHFNGEAKMEMDAFFKLCLEGMETDSQKLLAALIIRSLNKKLYSGESNENIYLKKYEISQIQLFNILIDKFPFVKYSQQITNNAIMNSIEASPVVTIIDIGIGQGTQIMNIIELSKKLSHLKKLIIVGIEPYADALSIAESNIMSCRDKVSFELEFIGIHDFVENIDFSAVKNMQGKIIVNASLALHHIQSDLQRTEIIANIKKVNPAAFILIEPNVNHFELDFHKRFVNCYNHFYSIFKVIDNLEIPNTDKNALKLFFGREIEDIIGKEDKDRFEKHEPAIHWINRLDENKFTIKNDFMPTAIQSESGVEIKFHKEGFLGFTVDTETVLAVIYAN